ncbi:DUF3572 family protein [Sphingomonas sp.]|uniref:DUF3572 family protein n=1 Tax=Sphingomonas sp. TaxID=28214 RepID=UPI003AFF74AF
MIRQPETTADAGTLGLRALAWTLTDQDRAERLLATTGLEADALRDRLGDPVVLGACLSFLLAHEPDLIACAADLDVRPEALARAAAAMDA